MLCALEEHAWSLAGAKDPVKDVVMQRLGQGQRAREVEAKNDFENGSFSSISYSRTLYLMLRSTPLHQRGRQHVSKRLEPPHILANAGPVLVHGQDLDHVLDLAKARRVPE